ncbi:MAG: glycosyltransferase [Deltaproteobacteria bacterium]|nr:glycosyltransferase [Deltaproteobacteria bacterium]
MSRVRCFAERGHNVHLLSDTKGKTELNGITEIVPSAPPGQDEWVRGWTRTAERVLRRKMPEAADMIRLMIDYRRIIKAAQPDLVHVHYAYATWGWMAAALGFKPLVVSVMGGDVLYEEQGSPTPLGIKLTKRLLKAADLITAKSNFLIGVLDSLGGYGSKAMRVMWGVDPEHFRPLDGRKLRSQLGIPMNSKVVLSPKIMSAFYNIHILVDAMAKVVESEPAARLVITEFGATPEYRAILDERIAALGLAPHVTFVGSIPHHLMPQFYAIADIAVGIPKSDGLPQTLLEAMACGVPNIVGQLDRYSEIVRDGDSAVFAEVNPDGVANAVLKLLCDPNLHSRIATKGRKLVVEQANFRRDVDRVEEEYYRLTNGWNFRPAPRLRMLSEVASYWLGK